MAVGITWIVIRQGHSSRVWSLTVLYLDMLASNVVSVFELSFTSEGSAGAANNQPPLRPCTSSEFLALCLHHA